MVGLQSSSTSAGTGSRAVETGGRKDVRTYSYKNLNIGVCWVNA